MFLLNKYYNFSTIAPSLLGGDYNHVKVLGLLNFRDALAHSTDITTLNSSVFTLLGATTIPSPQDMTYVKLEKEPGTEPIILSTAWIEQTSIIASNEKGVCTITIPDITGPKLEELRQTILLLGIQNAVIETTY